MFRVALMLLVVICMAKNSFAESLGDYELMMNAINDNNLGAVELLIADDIDLNLRVDSRASPTFVTFSAYLGRTEILAALLDAGANIEFRNGDARTPLLQAITAGKTETVSFLLSRGADINAVDWFGETAYSLAEKHPDIMTLLAAKRAE